MKTKGPRKKSARKARDQKLSLAAQRGDARAVQSLIEFKANVNHKDQGWSTLHYACHGRHIEVVRLLLLNNALPNVKGLDSWTPLHQASRRGNVEIVRLLLQANALCDVQLEDGRTPLLLASYAAHTDVVTLLLQHNANLELSHESGVTPLWAASQDGHRDTAALLIAHHANVNHQAQNGGTPLMVASQKGYTGVVALLIQSNADLGPENGGASLYVASQHGHREVVALLLAHNNIHINHQQANGNTPLYIASCQGHREVTALLITHKANIDLANNNGDTPLSVGSQNGDKEMVALLISHNANINPQAGAHPLFEASQNGHKDVVALLLTSNANINHQVTDGGTPLTIASQKGHTEVVALLIQHNANINLAAKGGGTPLYLASKRGHTDVTALLIIHKADINKQTNAGYVALHGAGCCGQTSTVGLLLSCKADPNIRGEGQTARDLAVKYNHLHCADIFDEYQKGTTAVLEEERDRLFQKANEIILNTTKQFPGPPKATTSLTTTSLQPTSFTTTSLTTTSLKTSFTTTSLYVDPHQLPCDPTLVSVESSLSTSSSSSSSSSSLSLLSAPATTATTVTTTCSISTSTSTSTSTTSGAGEVIPLSITTTTGDAINNNSNNKNNNNNNNNNDNNDNNEDIETLLSRSYPADISEKQLEVVAGGEGHTLGDGHFGVVRTARWRPLPTVEIEVAYKQLRQEDATALEQEFKTWQRIRPDKHVARLYGVVRRDSAIVGLISEKYPLNSLARRLRELQVKLAEADVLKLALGIARGLHHLHSNGIIHRDLGARNIFLSREMIPVLGDFGLARASFTYTARSGIPLPPVVYLAPETISYRIFSPATDIFSYGVVLWEITHEPEPRHTQGPLEFMAYYPQVRRIFRSCYSAHSKTRPSAEELVKMLESAIRQVEETAMRFRNTREDLEELQHILETEGMEEFVSVLVKKQGYTAALLRKMDDTRFNAATEKAGLGDGHRYRLREALIKTSNVSE